MDIKAFHLSAQGASHIKKNKDCQDASASYYDEYCAIAIVCDGHGGDDYFRSAIGSKAGVEVAEKNIKDFIMNVDKETFFSKPEVHIKHLEASIINAWNEAIIEYHQEHPFTEEELKGVSERARKRYEEKRKIESAYGTTMIAVAMNHDYWFGIHIGDGKCVAVNPAGEFKQPIPWDPKCFLNVTTSICDSDAINSFRHFYSEKLPVAVFVGSDGIDDCFQNNEQLQNLYKTVIYSFATTPFDEACDGLADYLPRLSAKGSGDDVSVAALLDLETIPQLAMVKEYDREKEKARVEENARKEAERNEEEKRRVEEERAKYNRQENRQSKEEQKRRRRNIERHISQEGTPEIRYCSNCGATLSSQANHCFNCGKSVERKTEIPDDIVKVYDPASIVTEPETTDILDVETDNVGVPVLEVFANKDTEAEQTATEELIPAPVLKIGTEINEGESTENLKNGSELDKFEVPESEIALDSLKNPSSPEDVNLGVHSTDDCSTEVEDSLAEDENNSEANVSDD